MSNKIEIECDDPTVASVLRRMEDRCKRGMATYGRSIRDDTRHDIAGWLLEAQEEILDFAVYIEKILEELHKETGTCMTKTARK